MTDRRCKTIGCRANAWTWEGDALICQYCEKPAEWPAPSPRETQPAESRSGGRWVPIIAPSAEAMQIAIEALEAMETPGSIATNALAAIAELWPPATPRGEG